MLALFNTAAGYGSETIRVSTEDEHYIVNWHTGEIVDSYTLSEGEMFRIRVLVQGQELGFADLVVSGSAKALRSVDTDEYIPLKEGRTLPIKFRIEEGALSTTVVGELASAGASHSCAVASNGNGYCWGRNNVGQLGIGTVGDRFNTPQLVTGGEQWQSIQASTDHTCGLTTAGQVLCWGLNSHGQLGLGWAGATSHPTPAPVIGNRTFQSLAHLGAGSNFSTCGVTTSGDMYCWGSNTRGELGRGTITSSEPTPGLVLGGHTFNGSVAMERFHTCGVTTTGDIACWGHNDFGQLGRGTVTGGLPTPALVVGTETFASVTTGAAHSCGVDDTGAALCWGLNSRGELGIGSGGGLFPTPQPVLGGSAFSQLSGGWQWTCGVTSTGEGLCWGYNFNGELGRGSVTVFEPTPGPVAGGHTFRSIGAGLYHGCGVTIAGDAFCWGQGNSGQRGDGTFVLSNPTPQFAIHLGPTTP